MLKASALYIVIIIALVIGLLCSSLIVTAYIYRIEYQKKFRSVQLQTNVNSGINILLGSANDTSVQTKTISLFGGDADSVSLHHLSWGIYDIGAAMAFIQKDTLYKTFFFANTVDSTKWAALYLIDEDRPFSLSGKTNIRGDAFIPKAGVQQAYVDNKAYQGDKRLIIGKKRISEKKLPALDDGKLKQLELYLNQEYPSDNRLLKMDSVNQSFLLPTRTINLKKEAQTIKNCKLSNNIVLFSDTTITLDSTAHLKNILVFARSIIVKSGFKGNCQLFAADSIHVDSNCRFNYPSCLGILRFKVEKVPTISKISIGNNTEFIGTVFNYERIPTSYKPLIVIGRRAKIMGQVYSQGYVEMHDYCEVDGSVYTSSFIYKTTFSLLENYLINVTINSQALSPYYLTSDLMPASRKKKKILQWIEAN